FLASLYLSLLVANELESFRLRVRGERVLVHDKVHAGSTILMNDETFGFVYLNLIEDFRAFQEQARNEIEACRGSDNALNPRDDRDDLIHYSVVPWISFSSFSHARRWNREDSTPKIVFGKFKPEGDRLLMPVSVEVHHALMDGIHVGEFFARFETHLHKPEVSLGLSSTL
ncbi:MAG: CatA-like O-acetyltransferase, partial [Rhodothermales bacterium]|nr:CatA-like O-acetyltransferase [Rhodothermales bacterium]